MFNQLKLQTTRPSAIHLMYQLAKLFTTRRTLAINSTRLNDNIAGVVAEFFICHAVNVMVPTGSGCSKSIPILIKEFQLSPLPLYVIDHDKIRGLTGGLCSP